MTTSTTPPLGEVASIERDVTRPAALYGRTLRPDDDTLATRGGMKGLRIYDDLKRDAHAGAVLGKRKLAVTARPYKVQPASNAAGDVAAAATVERALGALRFNSACKRLLDATLKGFAVSEIMWEVRDGLWLPASVRARDARRFIFTVDGELRLRTHAQPIDGEALPDRKFIVHRYGSDDDSPYGLGIGSALFWPVFFKRQGIKFWLTFADKFGSPTTVGKYPAGASAEDVKRLRAAMQALANDTAVTVPEEMLVELLEAQRSGSIDTYERLVRYMDEQISKVVLGETMSTTAAPAGLGSTQASVHNDVRIELARDDADELAETLNDTLLRWITEYNHAGAGLPKVERDFAEPEDLTARASRDKVLYEMGWQATAAYILDTYGQGFERRAQPDPLAALQAALGADGAGAGDEPDSAAAPPKPTDGDTAADAGDADEASAFAEGRHLGKASAQRAFNAARQAAIGQAAEQLAGHYQQLVGARVGQLVAELEASGDLVAFRERLADFVTAPPDEGAVQTIARAAFAGHLLGRGREPQRAGVLARIKSLVKKKDR